MYLTLFNNLVSVAEVINIRTHSCKTNKLRNIYVRSIFFPLIATHMRIGNTFQGHYIEKQPTLNSANMTVFLNPPDAANSKCLQYKIPARCCS